MGFQGRYSRQSRAGLQLNRAHIREQRQNAKEGCHADEPTHFISLKEWGLVTLKYIGV